jgi:predicted nuclease with TOPRIM domain
MTQLPALLKFTKERGKAADLQEKLEQLQTENLALHETLEAKDTEISNLRRYDEALHSVSIGILVLFIYLKFLYYRNYPLCRW